ncbi:MAG: branched-chain amino acid ABC transporter permease [Rhizobiaceae bacterium]
MDQIMGNIDLLIQYPIVNIKIILDGIMIGALFALAAYGLALVWGVMNVKNLAQGDFVIGGGYVSWWLHNTIGLHPLLGVPAAFIVMSLLAGALHGTAVHRAARGQKPLMIGLAVLSIIALFYGVYQGDGSAIKGYAGLVLFILLIVNGGIYNLVISRVIERDLFTSLLATFGLAIMGAQIMNLMFGSDTQNLVLDVSFLGLPNSFTFADGLIDLPAAKIVGVILAAIIAIGVILFMKRSRMGQAIRATAQDARAARVMGIDTEKVYAFTFSLNAAICGAAGAIIVMVWLIQPFYGITYSIRAFVIVTAAGLGNLPGVIAAGLGIGVAEQYGAHIFGISYQQAIAVLLLLGILVFRLVQQKRNRQVLQ